MRYETVHSVTLPKIGFDTWKIGGEATANIASDQKSLAALRPFGHPRQGWEAGFAAMAEQQDDHVLDEATLTQWDESDWEWA